jgi:riboflavin synthase
MFTGIVERAGRVRRPPPKLEIETALAVRLTTGGSISVNGACLTVNALGRGWFGADVVPETLRRTNLGQVARGAAVNLELPLALGDRLDGHLVQGHVDGTGRVVDMAEEEGGRKLQIEAPPELRRYLAEKGSITVDGVSLTISALTPSGFQVVLIPATLERSIAGSYGPGSVVNLEVDLLARYVERLHVRLA